MLMIFSFLMSFCNLQAAPLPPSSLCEIKGVVKSIKMRKEYYQDEPWAKSWGLPEFVEYKDVEIKVIASKLIKKEMQGSCEMAKLPSKFQLRDKKESLKVGSCISANFQYSGDEFSHGHWLFNIKNLTTSDCSTN